MKKNYILIFLTFFSVVSLAQQKDISITFDNYENNEDVFGGDIDLTPTFRNSGDVNWSANQAVNIVLWDKTSDIYHNLQTLAGSSNSADAYIELGIETPAVPTQTFPNNPAANFQTMLRTDKIWETFGKKKEVIICIKVLLGDDTAPEAEVTMDNNTTCINYTFNGILGVGSADVSQIGVYPNPASNQVNFNLGNVQVDVINVIDISGRIIDRVLVNNSTPKLSVDTYENGVYFYQIVKGSEVVTTDKFTVFN